MMIEQFIKRIGNIYEAIDSMYEMVKRHYQFSCDGCKTNCCETRFYHYTISEGLFLMKGFNELNQSEQEGILKRAEQYEESYKNMTEDERLMCPLNIDGLCILYKYRPMICRLHGVPYEVQDITMSASFHGGCERFMSERANSDYTYMTFNRTIFYREMSKIEEEIRSVLSRPTPTRKTVAQILLTQRNCPDAQHNH
ncbi:MAG: hypothetical protein N2738_07905 [Thermodesulfovibrionales bacterium]|nr:hypothetical protein [Thermodesulfovibrionales bacterium]